MLQEVLKSIDKEKLSAVQFLRNSAVCITYKNSADCDAAVASGIHCGDTALRVFSAHASARTSTFVTVRVKSRMPWSLNFSFPMVKYITVSITVTWGSWMAPVSSR